MLVEGDALWTVDDGQCPQAQTAIPEVFEKGAVMIWASRAEHSPFWTRTIGNFEPPPKRPRLNCEGVVEVFYSNITQWNNQAQEWLLQQEHQTVVLVETHLQRLKMEQAKAALCRSRWQPELMPAYETGRGGTSGEGRPIGLQASSFLTWKAMVCLPTCCNGRDGRLFWCQSI